MTRVHFVDGSFKDLYLNMNMLNDILDKNPNAKYLYGNNLTIVLDNVTYIEKLEDSNG